MAISTEHGPVLPASLTTTWGCQDLSYLSLGIGVAVCLIPVIEEAINRGFLLHYFLPNGKFIAILLSTLLFAVFHPPGAILPAAVIGTYLAVITLKTGSLLPATIGHCTHNFLVQLDVHCIAMDWVETSTTTGIARSADVAVGVTITLLIIAGTLVSSKVTGARPARP